MDTRSGEIIDPKEYEKLQKQLRDAGRLWELKYYKEMEIPPTPKQLARRPPKVGRNESCPCGSGKKFKKCCLEKATEGEGHEV